MTAPQTKSATPPDLAGRIPNHVAIIMDGNGRWARKRGLPRIKGHEQGAESVRAVIRACRQWGVHYLTLYAFSSENWVRPRDEVSGLMRLLEHFLKGHEYELHDNQVRLRVIGELEDLPGTVKKQLRRVMEATRDYREGTLLLALSYGGRREIVHAVQDIARAVREGRIAPEDIREETISRHLYAPDVPDPDLMIRTSGEMRLSNFLLWQLSYAELYITDTLWPDFREADFGAAMESFAHRKRRYGAVEET